VEQRYGKKARQQVFWSTTLLLVLIVGSVIVIQVSETYAQRKARIESEEALYVRIAFMLGDRACAVAEEDCHPTE
jgi:hypothetical protein